MSDVDAPLVTIIIVNHNYCDYVEQSIRSVDQQDYKNIQCIVLECASTDNSLSVIKRALSQTKNKFFQLLSREVNRGHVINALSALEEIKGDFVTYLDADDFLFPEFVTTHVKAHLNDRNSAALSVTDQIQIGAAGQLLAGTCHWHQKWRAYEPETAWIDLTNARTWSPNFQFQFDQTAISRLNFVPAWWSSWLMERWIWSATSGLMFRTKVIEILAPLVGCGAEPQLDVAFDGYFARFAHSVGGTLVIDAAQGAYRRHSKNLWSSNEVLGGQTPNGARDQVGRFQNIKRVARETLVAKYSDLLLLLDGELYYSIAWQLMTNETFLTFAEKHEGDRADWEKILKIAKASSP